MPEDKEEEVEAGWESFTWGGRSFLRGQVPAGEKRERWFTIAQPLAGRYQVRRFFAAGGMGLLLEGRDRRTHAPVLIKSVLRYDLLPYARQQDREGVSSQLRLPRKTLEMERRLLVLLRNAGCNAVPHPNDFVFDANPALEGPYPTEDGRFWRYDDNEMIESEPYLILEVRRGRSLEALLRTQPEGRLPEARALRIMRQVVEVLRYLHRPLRLRPGMTWQVIYQDLKPSNILVGEQDRVSVLDWGGCHIRNQESGQKLLPGACTPGYCPPECAQRHSLRTPAVDVYTVGSTLFHLLSGRSPLEFVPRPASGPQAAALDLRLLEGHCRPATLRLLARCLAPDPAERYPDAEALACAFEELEK
jgi:serine/threonine protein kinase